MLLYRDRKIGPALYRRIIGNDHHFLAHDTADTGQNSPRRNVAAIHPVGRKLGKFKPRRARIEQGLDPVTWQQLAAADMPLLTALAAPTFNRSNLRPQIGNKRSHTLGITLKSIIPARESGLDNRHLTAPTSRQY